MATVNVLRGEAVTVLPSAERTETPDVDTFRVIGGSVTGLVVVIDVTDVTDTPSVTFTIVGVDTVSDETWTVLASSAVTSTGTTVLRVHSALTAADNLVAKDVVPPYWSVTAVHADTDAITYSIAAYLA